MTPELHPDLEAVEAALQKAGHAIERAPHAARFRVLLADGRPWGDVWHDAEGISWKHHRQGAGFDDLLLDVVDDLQVPSGVALRKEMRRCEEDLFELHKQWSQVCTWSELCDELLGAERRGSVARVDREWRLHLGGYAPPHVWRLVRAVNELWAREGAPPDDVVRRLGGAVPRATRRE